MLRLASIMVLLHVATARAETDNDDAPVPPAYTPAPIVQTDPLELSHLRADGGLGLALGDVDAFAIRGHLGGSLWWISSHEVIDGSGWHGGVRVSGGAALGVDVRASRQYYTAAPFAELGLVTVKGREADAAAKQVTMFTRVEPVLFGGELDERGARIGVGFTLHGFGPIGFDTRCSGSARDASECELGKALLYPFALPVLAALNVRDVEFATDVGGDGRREYAMLFGFGV